MTKQNITDNQRAVLLAAARSANLVAWPVPAKLSAGAATIVVKGLLKKGLLAERPVLGEDAIWREDDDGRKLTVVITKTGMAAVGIVPGAAEENEAPAAPTGSDDEQPVASPEETAATPAVSEGVKAPRPGSKLAEIVALLSREEGATVEEMATAVGWQQHTVRGVMSGALVKKFGLRIASEPDEERGASIASGNGSKPGEAVSRLVGRLAAFALPFFLAAVFIRLTGRKACPIMLGIHHQVDEDRHQESEDRGAVA